jgi:hypothetical protein
MTALREENARLRAEVQELRRLVQSDDHPVRRLIVAWLSGRSKGSPVQFAREVDHPLGVVSYHFRVLHKRKAIRLAGKRPVRGAVEHYYALARGQR